MLSPIALAVDAYCGLFGNPPAHVRAHAERMRQLKARAYDLALQESLRIEREAEAKRQIEALHPTFEQIRADVMRGVGL